MATAKLSSRNQMVLPKLVREALGVKAGDVLLLIIKDGEVKLYAKPNNLTDYMQGLGQEVWAQLGGADRYLRQERESWG
ncbi:MAG: AbrB/MazE/SpoVT family DNA-binding domain-containing protein [Anaerolineae bacterium]